MDSTAITMAILTHPYQIMLMAVTLYYALRPLFSGRSSFADSAFTSSRSRQAPEYSSASRLTSSSAS